MYTNLQFIHTHTHTRTCLYFRIFVEYMQIVQRERNSNNNNNRIWIHVNRKFQESLCDHDCNSACMTMFGSRLKWQNFVTSNEQHQKMMITLYYALLCHIVFAFNNLVISEILWIQRAGKFRHSEIFKEPTHKHTKPRRKRSSNKKKTRVRLNLKK